MMDVLAADDMIPALQRAGPWMMLTLKFILNLSN
jgi:hypothetical protein